MTYHNPWLGLASYEETKGTENDYQFCGRDEETLDVVRLIDNNLFITLYGSSGIGKTSLLRAGVIPILRRKDYFPLYVRLSQEPKEISYAEAIVHKLQNSGLTIESGATTKHPDGNDRLYLWNYFATTRFFKEDREVYPVIILDQFEEVFREGDKAKAELLLKQIYLLLNDELEMPDEAGYSADTNYRFVASIREDFLFVLEDSIDANSLDLYKNNRYRLRPMKPENAREVVLIPGKDCVEGTEKDAIAERIIALATRPQSDAIDTLLLSLVCAGTYDKKVGEKIALDDLSIWKNNPMEVYYQEAIKGLSADQVRYIQQHLIREDGSRKRVDTNEVKAALGENTYQQLTQGKNRLFAIGDKGQVELLHDKLAMAVYEERKAFEERERKKKLRRRVSVVGALVLAIVGVFFFQNAKLKQQRWKMLESQSKLVADKTISLANEDSYLARLLAIETLPKDMNHPVDRPYTPEAERALRLSFEHNSAILRGHTNSVCTCAFSPDGELIVSSSWDSTLRIWNASTGKEIRILKGHNNAVCLAAFSPDGKQIVSVSYDSTLRIWNAETGAELKVIKDSAYVNDAKFSPDGKRIMFQSRNDIKIYDWENDETALRLINYSYANYSADGKYIVAIPKNYIRIPTHYNIESTIPDSMLTVHEFKLINADTGEELRTFSGQKYYVTSAAFSPDGKRIVSTSLDRTIMIWDVETGKELLTIKDKSPSLLEASFSLDGKRILSIPSIGDGTFTVWDAVTGEEIQTFFGHLNNVYDAAFSPNGKQIVSASDDMTLRIWDIPTIEESVIQTDVSSAAISYDGEIVAYFSTDSTLHILNTTTFSEAQIKDAKAGCFFYWNPLSFSHDGNNIVYKGEDQSLIIRNIEVGETACNSTESCTWLSSAVFSPDDKKLVTTSFGNEIGVWDADQMKEIDTIQYKYPMLSAVFSPDENHIVLASSWAFFDLLDAETGEKIHTLSGHAAQVVFTTFSPKGDIIVSASVDKTIRIWNAETGTCIKTLEGHASGVNYVAFSPDGKLFASASDDKTIRVWNVETGSCIHIIEGHTDAVRFVSFTSDGQHLISYSLDGTIRKWDFLPLQELIDQTRERFKDRPLTDEERKTYYLE